MQENEKISHPNMFKYLYKIYKNEGMGALYAGFGPRVMKIAPACAIMISSYEVGRSFSRMEITRIKNQHKTNHYKNLGTIDFKMSMYIIIIF